MPLEQEQVKRCPACGMIEEEWVANDGEGVVKEGTKYCCDGCATGRGCECS